MGARKVGVGYLIQHRYRLVRYIASGSFGDVFVGIDMRQRNMPVAVKIENVNLKNPMIILEGKNYAKMAGLPGIPKLYWYGVEKKVAALVIQVMGPSLDDMFRVQNGNLSLKTICLLGDQLIARIQGMHQIGLVHRDIKPENFMVGRGEMSKTLYIADFGLTDTYRNPDGSHLEMKTGRGLIGTASFVSINIHDGVTPSRRDDLISVGYVLLHLSKGSLPWQNVEDNSSDKNFRNMKASKLKYTIQNLCRGLPLCFSKLLMEGYRLRLKVPDNEFGLFDWLLCKTDSEENSKKSSEKKDSKIYRGF
eukprot:GHVP01056997.1.p1 GENE.GHVP01056997.1~~GHVP01056997.1.p1  ORF type:complete len:306 (+),score=48.08 GHVP01056997.1:47-964(+)